LTAPIFSNSRNFETEGDTPEKHGIKSLDPEEIYQFDSSFLVVSPSVSYIQAFEKIRAVNTFETASTPDIRISPDIRYIINGYQENSIKYLTDFSR